jgi:hypothetical protein
LPPDSRGFTSGSPAEGGKDIFYPPHLGIADAKNRYFLRERPGVVGMQENNPKK